MAISDIGQTIGDGNDNAMVGQWGITMWVRYEIDRNLDGPTQIIINLVPRPHCHPQ